MPEEEPRRFRSTATAALRIVPVPGEAIADGLVQPDPIERTPRRRRGVLWTRSGVITACAVGLGLVGFAIVTREPAAPQAAADWANMDDVPSSAEQAIFEDDTPAAVAGAAPCTSVTVLASLENADMVAELATGYNEQPRDIDGSCVTVSVTKDKSGTAATRAAASFADLAPDQRPTIWLPDSSSWLSVAAAKGATAVPAQGTSVAQSAIVLAMPAPLAFAIGWYNEAPTWQDVFAAADRPDIWSVLGHPQWGTFKLGKTSPLVATSGGAALLASFGAAGSGVGMTTVADLENPRVVAAVKQHELATSHYMATPQHFLWHAREAESDGGSAADFLSAMIVDEKTVWDYNRGMVSRDGTTTVKGEIPHDELVAVYPTDGVFVADNPAAILVGDWIDEQERAAAADFVRFAGTNQGQKIVTSAGYRDLEGRLAPTVQDIGILPRRIPTALDLPAADVVAALQDTFPHVRKRAAVLFLVDTSGSMKNTIPNGQTKLDAAKEAIVSALGHFTEGDSVGLAAFSSKGGAKVTPGLVTPVADIVGNRDALIAGVQGLKPQSYTPLHSAVSEFTRHHSANYVPDRVNAVVVLSDGANETTVPTITESQMLDDLRELPRDKPVLVFTLAYGSSADRDTLQKIASTSGALFYDASDPTQVTAILGELVTSF